jgi:hypothetical protein
MGICFTETEPSQEMQLKRLLGLLSGRGAVAVGGRAREKDVRENEVKEMSSVKETVRAADPGALVAELTAFFAKNKLLSRAKFYEIAKRVR